MHDDEQPVDEALVAQLLSEQFPQWADLPLAPALPWGTDNALYRLGDELAVRLPRIDWAAQDVVKEQRWLPVLGPQLPLEVPVPVGLGEPGAGYPWPWSVYRWLPGEPAVPPGDVEQAHALGGFARALHGLAVPDELVEGSRGVHLADRDEDTRTALAKSAGLHDLSGALDVWDEALAAPPWTGDPVWLHADLKPDNVLVHDGRLSAVIDFGALVLGDPAVDLLPAWNWFAGDARSAYRDVVALDDAAWARGRGWALSVAAIALPYYATRSPRLAEQSVEVLRHVLA